MRRRTFLKQTGAGALLLGFGAFPGSVLAAPASKHLVIVHSNDLHGCFAGPNGTASKLAWATLTRQIREASAGNMLLLDAGDHFGTVPSTENEEILAMSEIGFDAATFGQHDIEMGFSTLLQQYNYATFTLLSSNYSLNNTALRDIVKPYKVFERGGRRIGVFAVNPELKTLNTNLLNNASIVSDPVEVANATAAMLRNEAQCDLVICLSHLGFVYPEGITSDLLLAQGSRNIDFILGGNTHTFLSEPIHLKNADNKPVVISQAGFGGLIAGRIDLTFDESGRFHISGHEFIHTGAAMLV